VILDISDRVALETKTQRLLNEKTSLLKESHHRIKNNIASIQGLLVMHLNTIDNQCAAEILRDTLGRIASIRSLYDTLLDSGHYREMPARAYFERIIRSICAIFPESEHIAIRTSIADIQLENNILFPLGIAVNELLTNAMKYAFEPRRQGLVHVRLYTDSTSLILEVHDNGGGIKRKSDAPPSGGFGLELVRMIAESLHGEYSNDAHNGTRNTIIIPNDPAGFSK
jgi:two-component sensor histidine kinase